MPIKKRGYNNYFNQKIKPMFELLSQSFEKSKLSHFLSLFLVSLVLESWVYLVDKTMFWGAVGGSLIMSIFYALTDGNKRWI